MSSTVSSSFTSELGGVAGAESGRGRLPVPAAAVGDVLNRVTLCRNARGSFGFTLSEGAAWSLPFISRIAAMHVVAASQGEVRQGDYILAINDVCIAGKSHDQTIDLLVRSDASVDLVLLPNGGVCDLSCGGLNGANLSTFSAASVASTDSVDWLSGPLAVVLRRGGCRSSSGGAASPAPRAGYGFTITGPTEEQLAAVARTAARGAAVPKLRPGVFVSHVVSDSLADGHGVQVGMRVLTANGVDVAQASHEAATAALRSTAATGVISMVLRLEHDGGAAGGSQSEVSGDGSEVEAGANAGTESSLPPRFPPSASTSSEYLSAPHSARPESCSTTAWTPKAPTVPMMSNASVIRRLVDGNTSARFGDSLEINTSVSGLFQSLDGESSDLSDMSLAEMLDQTAASRSGYNDNDGDGDGDMDGYMDGVLDYDMDSMGMMLSTMAGPFDHVRVEKDMARSQTLGLKIKVDPASTGGVLVLEVDDRGAAHAAGLAAGCTVYTVNGVSVAGLGYAAVSELLAPPHLVLGVVHSEAAGEC